MQGNPRIVGLLNELLTMELTAINQYFLHAKMCESWGYGRLASRFQETSLAEMKDAEAIVDRILLLDGLPNLARLGAVVVGETVPEQLRLAGETERNAIALIRSILDACVQEKDDATRVFLEPSLGEEERHLDWVDTQLRLLDQLGEANYLAQQLHA